MIKWILQKIVGSKNQRELRRTGGARVVEQVDEAPDHSPNTTAWLEALRLIPLDSTPNEVRSGE